MKIIPLTVLFLTLSLFHASGADGDTESGRWLEQPLPQSWSYADDSDSSTPLPGGEWWRTLDDAPLDTLISLGLERNYNLRTALNRIEAARAAVGQARSAYYPTVGLTAGYSRAMTAGATQGRGISSEKTGAFNLGATMSWEIDVFGKITEQVRHGQTLVEVSRADMEGARLTIAAEIAERYVDLRRCQNQLAIAREHLASQKRVMEITEARYEAGLVSKLDVAQAKTIYYSTEATIPTLGAQCSASLGALALLTGAYPEEITLITGNDGALPPYLQLVSAGVPADLLRRRPDIIAAERTIEAQAQAVGIAKKDYLPSLSLRGSVGTAAKNIDGLFGRHSLDYEIAPTLSWTLFEGFYRKYAVAEARTQMQTAIDSYNYTVRQAIIEAENAMTAYKASVIAIESDRQALTQSREAFDLSVNQYKEGLSSFTNVMSAQISWLEQANTYIENQATALTNLIQLHRALGGTINP